MTRPPFRFTFSSLAKPSGDTFRALLTNGENGGVWLDSDQVPIRWDKGDLIEVVDGRLRYLGPPRRAPGWRWALRAAVRP